ncbi:MULTISPECIES: glycosyltransferase family 4 protein [unclassified Enterobacter]|uniref:glycosyltransferase family 4 protein n=1 Tax=unclassified Enterobacter TaxID=2608935 RepID=UPI0015C6ABDF|nr:MULTISPECIES: glycosyltransferase family 4 protein [unclassified Enterobacter]MBB3304168.1 glycosyltransferase involved in cell wall biosynthesis [Enterobacter sp. Sphag1F]NYI12727.1 glycosyltransferase involved in cell wall biosynthesis [Enterobacter sp. Sphag71]
MRIIYFVNTAWYFELHWIDRVNKLVKNGHEIHLISNFSNEIIKSNLERQGIKCWNLDIDRFSINLFTNVKMLIGFYILLKKIKPDLLHTITIKPNIIGGLISRIKGIPQIISVVGLGRVFLKDNLLRKIVKVLYKAILYKNNNVQLIFEHSSDKETLAGITSIDKSRLHVIDGAGIDIEKYAYEPEEESENTKVLFASRLLKSKGLELLVESIRKLKKEGIKIELSVAGIVDDEDPDRIPLSQVKSWEDEGLISWLGTRNDIEFLLRKCNIMVLPTKYAEGIPRIILEACSIGRTCIVGNMPGCQSIITDKVNGIVLKNHTIDTLSDGLRFLVNNPIIRKDYGIKSSNLIKDKFSKEIVISKTLQVYQNALIKKT